MSWTWKEQRTMMLRSADMLEGYRDLAHGPRWRGRLLMMNLRVGKWFGYAGVLIKRQAVEDHFARKQRVQTAGMPT